MPFFTFSKVTLSSGTAWTVAQAIIDFNGEVYKKAVEQARAKAQHTIASDQSGAYRSPELKLQRQLMGTLAEIYVQLYIQETLVENGLEKNWTVIRYDDVRTDDFKSPENEYDISIFKVVHPTTSFLVESRSSICKDRKIEDAIESFHIIGQYTSVAKSGEKENDFYVLPIYSIFQHENAKYLPSQFAEFLKSGKMGLFLIGGCSKKEMNEKGSLNSLAQGATQYRVLKVSSGQDVETLKKALIETLQNA